MGNISYYDPFDSRFEPLLRAWLQPVSIQKEDRASVKLDISANDRVYCISAELPGVSKDQVEVAIDKNLITISAEIKETTDAMEGTKKLLSERQLGRVTRVITLADEIDADAATARHVDGMLYLTLPKKASAEGKRLAVQ